MIKTRRELLLAIAAILIAGLLGFLVVILLHEQPAQGQEPQLYAGVAVDPKLLELDKRALDEAYHQHLIKLFGVWLSNTHGGDATAFTNGLRNARRAYNSAATQIAKRERELKQQEGNRP